jgi:Ca2+-binding RTX toxin-like protein
MRVVALVLAGMALVLLLASGLALAITKVGGTGNDRLIGTKGPDKLVGKGGRDNIEGRGGKDVIRGGPGSDSPSGTGSRGLHGDFGADVIWGGPGDDLLSDGPPIDSAVDSLGGGDGNDWLIASNTPAARDVLRCGAGRDRATVDREDEVRDCESVDLVP